MMIVLLRVSLARLESSEHVHGAHSGLPPYLLVNLRELFAVRKSLRGKKAKIGSKRTLYSVSIWMQELANNFFSPLSQ